MEYGLLLIWKFKYALDDVTRNKSARDLVGLIDGTIGNEFVINGLKRQPKLAKSNLKMVLYLEE